MLRSLFYLASFFLLFASFSSFAHHAYECGFTIELTHVTFKKDILKEEDETDDQLETQIMVTGTGEDWTATINHKKNVAIKDLGKELKPSSKVKSGNYYKNAYEDCLKREGGVWVQKLGIPTTLEVYVSERDYGWNETYMDLQHDLDGSYGSGRVIEIENNLVKLKLRIQRSSWFLRH